MGSKIKGNNVLTIGCDYMPPKGGVAQVIYTYKNEVYDSFHFIKNSGNGSKLHNVILALWGCLKLFLLMINKQELRLVHIHTASFVSFRRAAVFVNISKLFNRNVILHIHGGGFRDYYKTNPQWILSVLNRCDRVIALTDSWQSFFYEIGCKNVFVVKNIIPNPLINNVEKDKMIHFLFLGWIVKEKGVFDIVDVLSEHKEECEGKIILHIGGDHEVEKLKNIIVSNKLEGIVRYEGWVSGGKKTQLLNMMDAFILPSYMEGLPISILESLSYGKPVITTPVGGIPEVVNQRNGFFFKPGDKREMWSIIKSIISHPDQLSEKSKAAKSSVKENMSDAVINQLKRVYEGLC